MNPTAKIVAIRGGHSVDCITQKELGLLVELQSAAWAFSNATIVAISEIQTRIANGARVEHGKLEFDLMSGNAAKAKPGKGK